MGLSNFPSPAEGVLPVLVMNTVMSVAILKNLLRSFLQLVGAVSWVSRNFEESSNNSSSSTSSPNELYAAATNGIRRMRGVSITQFKNLCEKIADNNNNEIIFRGNTYCCDDRDSDVSLEGRMMMMMTVECCVCLCKFEDEEEVSELSCKHFFHRNCLEKWFDNHHSTCPLCRSIH